MRPERSQLAGHWALDPDVVFLNHGSFGACPSAVLEEQSRLRARLERQPATFLAREPTYLEAQIVRRDDLYMGLRDELMAGQVLGGVARGPPAEQQHGDARRDHERGQDHEYRGR